MIEATDKRYYSISEVSEATGVKPHVLRYWESQFSMLRPRKSRGGVRMYRPKDMELIGRIKHLLYERGFTIAGAKRRLLEDRRGRTQETPEAAAAEPQSGPGADPPRREVPPEPERGRERLPNLRVALREIRDEMEVLRAKLKRESQDSD